MLLLQRCQLLFEYDNSSLQIIGVTSKVLVLSIRVKKSPYAANTGHSDKQLGNLLIQENTKKLTPSFFQFALKAILLGFQVDKLGSQI